MKIEPMKQVQEADSSTAAIDPNSTLIQVVTINVAGVCPIDYRVLLPIF